MYECCLQTLVVGRLVLGLAIGMTSGTTPLYVAEAAPPDIRGQLVTLNDFMICAGQVRHHTIEVHHWKRNSPLERRNSSLEYRTPVYICRGMCLRGIVRMLRAMVRMLRAVVRMVRSTGAAKHGEHAGAV
eukprot:1181805-Prorocentrum_minimum.AAC.1